jgi:two-component system phosphate regulon sensor histidine kinase PhoR
LAVDPTTGTLLAIAVVAALGTGLATLVAIRARGARDVERARTAEARDRADLAAVHAARAHADLEEVVERVGVGVIRLSDDLAVEIANDAALAALGRDRQRVVGRPAFEAFADQRIVDLVTTVRSTMPVTIEIGRDGPDGTTIAARASRSPAGGIWLIVDDVSELRRLQRIRAEFIDNLSHELRTPLTSLGLLTETLARDVEAAVVGGDPVTPRMHDRVGRIQLETGHLTQMVTEMLELSRIEAGGAASVSRVDDVEMAELAVFVADRSRAFTERAGVSLHVEADLNVAHVVRGDRDRLGQVLLNLIHNAVKFSPSGGEVVVAVRCVGGDVVTDVVDRGIGIPPEAQERIFERFYKVDRARGRSEGGTGLGLAIARHIVEAHGGRIGVTSVEGAGSTFSFTLPAVVPTEREAAVVAG